MVTIKDARLAKDWTQDMLADAAGVSIPVVSRLENRKLVSHASLRRVARALGISPDEVDNVVVAGRAKRSQAK